MRAFFFVGALLLYPCQAVAVEVTEAQMTAALFEWTLAHCGLENVQGLTALLLPMVINGSEPGEMEEARRLVRERIAGQFASREVACVDLTNHFQGQ